MLIFFIFRNYYFTYSSKFGAKIQITIVYNKKKMFFFKKVAFS